MSIERDLGYLKGSVGSREYVLNNIRPQAEQFGNQRLVDKTDLALGKYREASSLRVKYLLQRKTDGKVRNEAVKIDADLDATLGDLHTHLKLQAGRRRDSAKKRAAQKLLNEVFQLGVFPITSSRYDEQHSLTTSLIDNLEQNYPAEIDAAGARDLLDDVKAVNDDFGEALDIIDRENITYDMVQAKLVEAEEVFKKVMLIIHGDYCDDEAKLAALTKAAEEQDERTSAYYKRRGKAPEVDPNTGEPIEDPDVEPVVDEDVVDEDVDEPVEQ